MPSSGDSYCGIYCDACSVRMHGRTGRADGFVGCCAGVPKAELACEGCKSDALYAGCRVCSFRDCARKRGVEHCAECAEYPCTAYRHWQSAARILPHVAESAGNLAAVKRDGTEAWLAAQQRRWSCSACGAPFSWYATECPACGRPLGHAAHPMTGWRRLVCRFVLPRVYRRGRSRVPSTKPGGTPGK